MDANDGWIGDIKNSRTQGRYGSIAMQVVGTVWKSLKILVIAEKGATIGTNSLIVLV